MLRRGWDPADKSRARGSTGIVPRDFRQNLHVCSQALDHGGAYEHSRIRGLEAGDIQVAFEALQLAPITVASHIQVQSTKGPLIRAPISHNF